MPTINENLRKRLIAKYGTELNLESRDDLLNELIKEISAEAFIPIGLKDGYDKHYTEGYNKMDYSKSDYSRYDKTNDFDFDIMKEVISDIRPELQKLLLEKIRGGL